MLTKKQNELLIYINQNLRETGVAPSYEEMREALDLRSKSGIHRLINALEERGFIRRLPHRARAIEVTKLPSASSQNKNANFNIQRFKGLGEMMPKQLWDTTMNPQTRMMKRVEIEDALEADRIFNILMGDKVAPRREFIETHSGNLDMATLDI